MEPDVALGDPQLSDEEALRMVVEHLAATHPTWGWVGVYLLTGDTLVLGPYVGPTTEHTRIPVGRGVCGTAVAEDRNLVVDDVRHLDNYLACSVGTRSEIVVLIRDAGEVVGQFDVDSDAVGAFGPPDEALLERLAGLAGPRCRRLAAAGVGQGLRLPDPSAGLEGQGADDQRRHRVGPPPSEQAVQSQTDDEDGR
jgi:L-methionine (R)-S-oxide reductase